MTYLKEIPSQNPSCPTPQRIISEIGDKISEILGGLCGADTLLQQKLAEIEHLKESLRLKRTTPLHEEHYQKRIIQLPDLLTENYLLQNYNQLFGLISSLFDHGLLPEEIRPILIKSFFTDLVLEEKSTPHTPPLSLNNHELQRLDPSNTGSNFLKRHTILSQLKKTHALVINTSEFNALFTKEIEKICKNLGQITDLTIIMESFFHILKDRSETIFSRFPMLTSLSLKWYGSGTSMTSLEGICHLFPKLHTLKIECLRFGVEQQTKLFLELSRYKTSLSNLRSIEIHGVDESIIQFHWLLDDFKHHCPQLQSLSCELGKAHHAHTSPTLGQIIKTFPGLKALRYIQSVHTDGVTIQDLSSLSELQSLTLSMRMFETLSFEEIERIFQGLPHLSNLTIFPIESSHEIQALQAIFSGASSLRFLKMTIRNDDKDYKEIFESLPKSLQQLEISEPYPLMQSLTNSNLAKHFVTNTNSIPFLVFSAFPIGESVNNGEFIKALSLRPYPIYIRSPNSKSHYKKKYPLIYKKIILLD